MAWLLLILAGLSEIVWAYGLKMTNGFTHLEWSAITIVFMIISFLLFGKAMKEIPIGTAYAVFTGIGAAGTAVVGILILNEAVNFEKILSLVFIIGGIVGLKLLSSGTKEMEGGTND